MIEEDERYSNSVSNTSFYIDIRLTFRSPSVKDAKVCSPDAANDVLKDLYASGILSGPVQLDVVGFQDLSKVPT